MIQLVGPINTGIATGGDGSATSNQDSSVVISGVIVAIAVRPNFSYLSTSMDVSIKTKGTSAPELEILSISSLGGEGWYHVRPQAVDGQGGDIADLYAVGVPVYDIINVKLEAANDDDTADVWFLVDG
jgi:hypothetical protein